MLEPTPIRPRPLSAVRTGSSTVSMTPGTALRLGVHGCPPLLLAGLRLVLEAHAEQVRLRPVREAVDVVLADAAHRSGPPRLPEVDVPLVVLVREGDLAAALLVRQAGGTPVPVTAQPSVLVQAVESAHRASKSPHRRPDPRRELHAAHPTSAAPTAPLIPLSAREEQVLGGVCAGLSNEDIAAELYVSINSVKTYIRSAYRKMGVVRRGQAVVWGMQRGYGDPVPLERTT